MGRYTTMLAANFPTQANSGRSSTAISGHSKRTSSKSKPWRLWASAYTAHLLTVILSHLLHAIRAPWIAVFRAFAEAEILYLKR